MKNKNSVLALLWFVLLTSYNAFSADPVPSFSDYLKIAKSCTPENPESKKLDVAAAKLDPHVWVVVSTLKSHKIENKDPVLAKNHRLFDVTYQPEGLLQCGEKSSGKTTLLNHAIFEIHEMKKAGLSGFKIHYVSACQIARGAPDSKSKASVKLFWRNGERNS